MIVRIKGGMGNQMFQYALIKQLETVYGLKDVKADFQFFTRGYGFFEDRLSALDVKYTKATDEDIAKVCFFRHDQKIHTLAYKIPVYIEKTFNPKYFFEPDRAYRDPKALLKYEFLDGYWQSYRYTQGIEAQLKNDFRILYRCSEKTKIMAEKMSEQNAVMVGVRRGDYAANAKNRKHYYQISQDYFERSVRYIAERTANPVFYIFSNDIEWAKENLHLEKYNVVYRDKEDQFSDIEEMQLMSVCKHAVIPNSTFHWFGAWLQDNPNKIVIRPKLFFADGKPSDLYPPEWVCIE